MASRFCGSRNELRQKRVSLFILAQDVRLPVCTARAIAQNSALLSHRSRRRKASGYPDDCLLRSAIAACSPVQVVKLLRVISNHKKFLKFRNNL